ncbi:MAG: heat-shock protein Hsp20 [Variovorax sp.]|jgi:HSP20 family protein|nr:heat-shock protein Hsp20 [Variovorax sp.]
MNNLETRKPEAKNEVAKTDRAPYSDAALTPAVDVVEDSGGITLYADLPGVSKEKLNIQAESDSLTIEAELNVAVPEDLHSTHTEVALGRFRRTFRLSKELEPSKVTAKLAQGVLTLRIPKAEHAQPRRIPVEG